MDKISEGRIVRYHFTNSNGETVDRPAIVVNAWNNERPDQQVNLIVFPDGENDFHGEDFMSGLWVTAVPFADPPVENSWHWPPRN